MKDIDINDANQKVNEAILILTGIVEKINKDPQAEISQIDIKIAIVMATVAVVALNLIVNRNMEMTVGGN